MASSIFGWELLNNAPCLAATLGAYCLFLALQRRISRFSNAHGLLLTAVATFWLMKLAGTDHSRYLAATGPLTFLLTPATVALALPMHVNSLRLRQHLHVIILSVIVGTVIAIVSAGICLELGGDSGILGLSMMPKSATAAISTSIARQIGGIPEWTAIFTVVTGLLGALTGPWLLRRIGVRDELALGTAVGTAAHGIGTARVMRDSEHQGSASALAMSLGGIATALIFMILQCLP